VIDIHCHILPGMDDGPATEEESLEMCEIAARDGIRTIVATPHTGSGVYSSRGKDVKAAVSRLNASIKKKRSDLTILPGHDTRIYPELIDDIVSGKVLTMNDARKYVLLELPVQSIPFYVERVIEKLKEQGIRSIISHPERNYHVQADPDVLKKFLSLDVIFQITAMSLTGGFGEPAQDTAVRLLEKGLAHIIASDAHSKGKRPPALSAAVEKAAEIIGMKKAQEMVTTSPQDVVT